jgi:hypothetical protein
MRRGAIASRIPPPGREKGYRPALYVLDQDTAKFGQGSDFSWLKQQPVLT